MFASLDDLIDVIEVEEKKAVRVATAEQKDAMIKTQSVRNNAVMASRHLDVLSNSQRVVRTTSLIWIR